MLAVVFRAVKTFLGRKRIVVDQICLLTIKVENKKLLFTVLLRFNNRMSTNMLILLFI